MGTILGSAKIQVTLDVVRATKQLDDLERKVKDIPGISQISVTASEREFGESATKKKDKDEKDKSVLQQLEDVFEKPLRPKILRKVARWSALGAAVGVASVFADRAFAAAAQVIRPEKGDEGIISDLRREFADKFDLMSNKLSDAVANFKAAIPTTGNVKDIVRSKLLLGEAPSYDEVHDLWHTLFRVNDAAARLELQRDKLVPQAIGRQISDYLSGGAKK